MTSTLVDVTDFIVKCGRYPMTMFVKIADCRACSYHRGIVKINEAANDRPEVNDVLCGVPVHRRIEYIAREVDNASSI